MTDEIVSNTGTGDVVLSQVPKTPISVASEVVAGVPAEAPVEPVVEAAPIQGEILAVVAPDPVPVEVLVETPVLPVGEVAVVEVVPVVEVAMENPVETPMEIAEAVVEVAPVGISEGDDLASTPHLAPDEALKQEEPAGMEFVDTGVETVDKAVVEAEVVETVSEAPVQAPVVAEVPVLEVVEVKPEVEPAVIAPTEPSVVAEPMSPTVSAPASLEPTVDVSIPATPTPIQNSEQPVEVAKKPASASVEDLASTPHLAPDEALKSEIATVISTNETVPIVAQVASKLVQSTIQRVQASVSSSSIIRDLLGKAHLATEARKRKKLARVMDLFTKQTNVVNDDVEKLLHISDATASRYLGILEKENRIKRVGTAGRWVSYTKNLD